MRPVAAPSLTMARIERLSFRPKYAGFVLFHRSLAPRLPVVVGPTWGSAGKSEDSEAYKLEDETLNLVS